MSTVDILLPTPLRGSGGIRTVVANAQALTAAGHQVRLHVQTQRRTRNVVRRMREWFPVGGCEVRRGWPSALPDSDALMATVWFSAPHVAGMVTPARKLYFVQDYEPLFHPAGDLAVAAASTYDLGLETLVIGSWLQHKLLDDHGVATGRVPFTADLRIYQPGSGPRQERVVAMYQPDKPRRCPQLVVETLARVLAAGIEVVTVGAETNPRLGPGHEHLGLVDVDTLAGLYRTSAVGLVMSATNPSRVPFEMMACGLPVVEAHLPNTVFDLPEGACLLARPDPDSLAEAIRQAAREPERGDLGPGFMRSRDAQQEHAAFAAFVESSIDGAQATTLPADRLYRSSPVHG